MKTSHSADNYSQYLSLLNASEMMSFLGSLQAFERASKCLLWQLYYLAQTKLFQTKLVYPKSFDDVLQIFIRAKRRTQPLFTACYNQSCSNGYQNYCFECSNQLLALFALLYYWCERRRLQAILLLFARQDYTNDFQQNLLDLSLEKSETLLLTKQGRCSLLNGLMNRSLIAMAFLKVVYIVWLLSYLSDCQVKG